MTAIPSLLTALALAASSTSAVDLLAGRYARAIDIELNDGSIVHTKQSVEILPVDRGHAYVRAELDFVDADHCGIFGIARLVGNTLIYTERTSQPGEMRCRLSIAAAGSALRLDDGGTCRGYCGARASLTDFRFLALASKRPIADAVRVRRSDEYRVAIDEWNASEGIDRRF